MYIKDNHKNKIDTNIYENNRVKSFKVIYIFKINIVSYLSLVNKR